MSKIEEPRRRNVESVCHILDERGIKYYVFDEDEGTTSINSSWSERCDNFAKSIMVSGATISAMAYSVTPKEAVKFLFGETCEMHPCEDDLFVGLTTLRCSECGCAVFHEYQVDKDAGDFFASPYPRFCPNCGRRVVQP
jgi:hypothetical protein